MDFTKMNGNGNDFIVIENLNNERSSEELSRLAKCLCTRRHSIGADGLLVVEVSESAHFKMRLFNRDGSEAEMCGNGARCICRYACDRNIAPSDMIFETLAGTYRAQVDGWEVKIDMGLLDLRNARYRQKISIDDKEIQYNYMEVGVPHCVVFLDDLLKYPREELLRIGRALRYNTSHFPQGVNVNFAEIIDKSHIHLITYERGVEDLTKSCGTGSASGVIVSRVIHDMDNPVIVRNLGGENRIFVDLKEDLSEGELCIQGRAVYVAQGAIHREGLVLCDDLKQTGIPKI